MRLITAWSGSRRNSRGRGLPACGRGVTVPVSTKPNPSRISAGTATAFLSNPAARPIGLANRRPSTSTGQRPGSCPRVRPAKAEAQRAQGQPVRALRIEPSHQRHEGGCDRGRHGARPLCPPARRGESRRSRASLGGADPFPEPRVVIGACCARALGLSGRALGCERPCAKLFDGARRSGCGGHRHAVLASLGAGRLGRRGGGGGLAQDATSNSPARIKRPRASSPRPGSGTLLALVIELMSLCSSTIWRSTVVMRVSRLPWRASRSANLPLRLVEPRALYRAAH